MEMIEGASAKKFVRDLRDKETVSSVFLAAEKALLKDKNGKPYLSLSLKDASGVINARAWDRAEDLSREFEAGDFILVKGHVQMFQNRLQMIVHSIARVRSDQFSSADFVSRTSANPEDMLAELESVIQTVQSPYIRTLLERTLHDPDIRERLKLSPAAKSIHHAYLGGLLEHIVSITRIVVKLADHYGFMNRDLLIFGAIYHDLGKVWELNLSQGIQYSDQGRLVGHMVLAVEAVERLSQAIPAVPGRLKDILKHMILSHHGKLEYGSPKEPALLEAMVVAMVDDLDSKIASLQEFLTAEAGSGEGSWSRLHPQWGRFFLLDFFRERVEEVSGKAKSTNSNL